MYVMAWTNDTVIEFLNLYKNEPILWDPKNPLHRNRPEVSEAWARIQISFSLNCSIQELKKKKESLMTVYRKYWNKKQRTLGNYRSSWFAYPFMESFLTLRYECDSTSQIDSELCDDGLKQQEISSDDNLNQRISNKMNRNTSSSLEYVNKDACEDMRLPDNNEDILDEYDLYGELLAKKLRQLAENQRDVAMHEIDNIMFRVKMQNAASPSRSLPSSPSPVRCKMESPVFIVMEPSLEQFEDENSYDEYPEQQ